MLIPNLTPSCFVCPTTAKGANINTGLLVCLDTCSAHVNCIKVLPNPQSAKIAYFPAFNARLTINS